jgi:hypothetical protein
MNCSRWAQFKTGHNLLSQTLNTVAKNGGLSFDNTPTGVPTHPGWSGDGTCRRQADACVLLPNDGLTGPSQRVEVVMDFTIVHPRHATGSWKPDALDSAAKSKRVFHEQPYRGLGYVFVPAASTTYGHLHHEFVRLLFLMASRQAKHILTFDSPDSFLSFKQIRGMCFSRMKSAVSFAVAKGMVMRAFGVPCHNIRYPAMQAVRDQECVDHNTHGLDRPSIA